MAIYRRGKVNCGHCNEPTGIPADDWAGETRTEDGDYVASVDPCVRCQVHTYGLSRRLPRLRRERRRVRHRDESELIST
ncbi:hypothetical protein AB0C52_35515 [Streptomyces sp. NPDC048717]|uniref:hypothetical protein n=1 Tax=Streptomyces sp. NPDC048717 TaxID=3154928 RepID=UPI0034310927